MKIIVHIAIVFFLTLITQVGGLLWMLCFGLFRLMEKKKPILMRVGVFLASYFFVTLFIIPFLANLCGRVPLPLSKSGNLIPHNIITPLLNRHYVKPELKQQLIRIGYEINTYNKSLKVSYLDANFPFIDGFPLLPHLSHNDGRKVDLSFYYTLDDKPGNYKPANSGYGKFVPPLNTEFNQTKNCKSKGYWQYDYTQYLTLGSRNDLEFDKQNTKRLIDLIINEEMTEKLFIEPHLKDRMNLKSDKIRFQGCRAVRHDDHIHFQIH